MTPLQQPTKCSPKKLYIARITSPNINEDMRRTRSFNKKTKNVNKEDELNSNKNKTNDQSPQKLRKNKNNNESNPHNYDKNSSSTSLDVEKSNAEDSNSSSDSDLDNYLQPADEIDLNSSFFQVKSDKQSFQAVENSIFAGIDRLSESESEDESTKEQPPAPTQTTTTKINFQQLHNYTKKLEEAKHVIAKYEARTKAKRTKKSQISSKEVENGDNILSLLSKGETTTKSDPYNHSTHHDSNASSEYEQCSDSEKDDWEEVEANEVQKPKDIVPKEGVQITLELPAALRQKKKQIDLMACMKRRLNRIKKETQVYIHKVHLLCWLAHGNYVNKILNAENLMGLALSLIPSQHCYPSDRVDLKYLEQIVKWYKNKVPVTEKPVKKDLTLEAALTLQLTQKRASNKKMLVYIFICILRSLGIQCRLVLSFQVAPIRPPASELHSLSTKTGTETKKEQKPESSQAKPQSKSKSSLPKENKSSTSVLPQLDGTNDSDTESTSSRNRSKVNLKKLKENVDKQGKRCPNRRRSPRRLHSLPDYNKEKDSDDEFRSDNKERKAAAPRPPRQRISSDGKDLRNSKRIKNLAVKLEKSTKKEPPKNAVVSGEKKKSPPKSSSRYFSTEPSPGPSTAKGDVRNDIISIMKTRLARERTSERQKLVKPRRTNKKTQGSSDYDSDYAPEPIKKKKHDSDDEFHEKSKIKVKRRVQVVKQDEDADQKLKEKKEGMDVWIEIYLEAEEKWISADVTTGQIHCINELHSRASHPISYIVSWNNDNSLKDITQRYCPNWNTVTRKLRVDKKWWEATLRPFLGKKTARDREEDEELARLQLEKPLPTTISEYKNHPLYVLKRHLLKFEAIYPSDAVTLGFVRNEPVYSRDCVHTLHSREIWVKHAKVVKPKEQPYKIVKARPKYDKLSGQVITDLPLEVFGKWQVEDYVPPIARDGVVPRNAYGNVELFKACMLPKGTVHLQLPGLNKVAKKLNIDCAPAVVGFDFHAGGSHPTFDGFVVCEEHSETLVAAWYTEQEEQEKREQEKIDKRVYGNWKKLIRGLLIRERLKARYNYGQSTSQGDGKKRKTTRPRFLSKKSKVSNDSQANLDRT